jgi:ribosomal protein S18 acetylase RimI-like enzyme
MSIMVGRSSPQFVVPGPRDWREWRALRLEALRREPFAYDSTYDEAVTRPDTYWIQRLTGDEGINLVAIVEGRMVGMVSVHLAADDDPSVAVVVGLYVSDEQRGLGLGRGLMEAVMARLADRAEIATIRLWVNPNQIAARTLYMSLGFQFVLHPEDADATAGTMRMERPARPD